MSEIYEKQGKKVADSRLANKIENEKKDTKIRQQEKMWDKTVEDLSDDKPVVKSPEVKVDIKLNLTSKKDKDVKVEKGFGKFTWVKQEEKETPKETAQNDQEKTEKTEEKKGISINLTGKSIPVRSTGGVYGKKNPLLPPWRPVGRQSDKTFPVRKNVQTEKESPAGLDMFLTSNKDGGKIPVIGEKPEKKKISAKEILEAFSGKYKEKDIQPKSKQDDTAYSEDSKTDYDNKTDSNETNDFDKVPIPPAKKSKKEIQEEKDMEMMGIEPSSIRPLAPIKPPPPISQNMTLPSNKAAASCNQLNNAFYQDVTLDTIPLPFDIYDKEKTDEIKNQITDMTMSQNNDGVDKNAENKNLSAIDSSMKVAKTDKQETETAEDSKTVKEDTKASNEIGSSSKDVKTVKENTKEYNKIENKLSSSTSSTKSETKNEVKLGVLPSTPVITGENELDEVAVKQENKSLNPVENTASVTEGKPRGRGRGASRGRGRGRGRGAPARSTRTTRSMVSIAEEKSDVTMSKSTEENIPGSIENEKSVGCQKDNVVKSPEMKSVPATARQSSSGSGQDKGDESDIEGIYLCLLYFCFISS